MSPDMASFGFIFLNDSNRICVMLYMRIDWMGENSIGQGIGHTEIRF
jgi:hypothetical protein